MPIVDSDIIVYGSAVMAEEDTTTNIGGAIDTSIRIVFTDIDATGIVEMVSSAAGDTTQTVTVYGRNAAGELFNDAKTCNGTTVVDFTGSFERIMKVTVGASHTGTITIRKDAAAGDLMDIEPGVLEVRRPFYDVAADVGGGSARTYYEKIFFWNDHATLSLTNATIAEQADPSGNLEFDLATGLGDTGDNGAFTRQTAPGGYTFDGTTKNVANSQNHTAQAGQAVWLKLSLAAGASAAKTTYTLRESGTTV